MKIRDDAPQWLLDRIARALEQRRVSGRVAARIMQMLDDEPQHDTMGHNKDINAAVKARIEREP